ncbi:hypothetical protein, partial [Arsenicibacter rosenii]|uniref:hypothetical protein n=1 Tax=Arsenicibacter rosenii TaxID=1750698 RepID=UPI0015A706AE
TGSVKVEKSQIQKLGKTPVDVPVENLDTLRQLVADDAAAPAVTDNKKVLKQRAEEGLMIHMQELITSKNYTRKRIDQLIEKATALKMHLK